MSLSFKFQRPLLAASLLALIAGCSDRSPTIDASSDQAFKDSIQEVSNALDDETREEFEDAMQVLLFSGSNAKNLLEWSADIETGGMERRFKAKVDGMTAAEVIAAAKEAKDDGPWDGPTLDFDRDESVDDEREKEKAAREEARAEAERRVAEAAAAAAEERASYLATSVQLYGLEASYRSSYLDDEVAGVLFKLKNTGDRTLERVEVTVYFRDASGATIAEEDFYPVSTSSFSGNNKPLKPGYVWQMEQGKFYAAKSVPSEWKEGSVAAEVTEIWFAEIEEGAGCGGVVATPVEVEWTGGPASLGDDRKATYIDQHVQLYGAEARYRSSFTDDRVPGVLFKLKNTGEETLERVEVTFYFQDASGAIIAEEDFYPVSTGSFAGNNKPLKPGYVWQMEQGKFYAAKSVPSEWKEGRFEARVTDVRFAEQE